MDANKWLKNYAPGFSNLSNKEKKEIRNFSLLWSLFECKVLKPEGEETITEAIKAYAKNWANRGLISDRSFTKELSYFRRRYYKNGAFTNYFQGLRLGNQNKQLIEPVLKNDEADCENIIAGLFLLIYCLRNNYFHGDKWDNELRDQFDNFKNANSALMQTLDIRRNSPNSL